MLTGIRDARQQGGPNKQTQRGQPKQQVPNPSQPSYDEAVNAYSFWICLYMKRYIVGLPAYESYHMHHKLLQHEDSFNS